jgi:hypothetical protein
MKRDMTEAQAVRLTAAKAELERVGLMESDSPVGRYALELFELWVTQDHTLATGVQTMAVLERLWESRSLGPEEGLLWFHRREDAS